jgi:cAMP-dependent protein kinase regulator
VSGPSSTQPSSPPGPSQPEYPKSKAAIERIKRSLPSKFLFSHLEEGEIDQVVGAFSEVSVSAGEDVIRQGDDGDNFYLVGEGELEVVITDGNGNSRLVSTLVEGDMFGELALMYNCPRAATVRAVVDGRLYALRQEVFQHIVRSSAQERRMQYEHFLARIPLLQGLSAEDRGRVADVLVQASYKDGEYIIRQGDQRPDSFFILLEGFATARKSYQGTAPVDVMQYKRGDYFGEVALLNNVSRCGEFRV